MVDHSNRVETVVTPAANEIDEVVGASGVNSRDQKREIEALRAELQDLRDAARRPPLVIPPAKAGSVREEVEFQVRRKPIMAVGLAALVGFIYGIAR